MLPSDLYLILQTHLQPMGCLPTGSGVNVHVLFSSNTLLSMANASCQFLSLSAVAKVLGFEVVEIAATNFLYDGDNWS